MSNLTLTTTLTTLAPLNFPNSSKSHLSAYNFDLEWENTTWILLCGIIIFTMQTGFGFLESGVVSKKNQVNILMKNIVDVILGGLTYWLFGFAISFGQDFGSNSWIGFGEYLVDAPKEKMGPVFTTFFFQLSFATTATTIVSGSMAERCNFKAYCLFSLFNTVVYCFPARWIFSPSGFLFKLGVSDIAGSGAVHLVGGSSAFVAAYMLGPRIGRYDKGRDPLPIKNPMNCLIGFFMLYFTWIAFNAGSTFGVTGESWKFASRACATTMIGSIGSGLISVIYMFYKNKFEIMDIINPILGGLVGVTSPSSIVHTTDAFAIGIIGGIVIILTASFTDRLKVDDPIGATCVHGFGGVWGMLAVGLFSEDDGGVLGATNGLFRGGGFYLLGVQVLAICVIILYSSISTFIILWVIDKLFYSIRLEPYEEILGADYIEHYISPKHFQNDYPPELYYDGCREEIIQLAKDLYSGDNGNGNSSRTNSEIEILRQWTEEKDYKVLPQILKFKARRVSKKVQEIPQNVKNKIQIFINERKRIRRLKSIGIIERKSRNSVERNDLNSVVVIKTGK